MNKLRDFVGIFAICATSVIFTGCGGDDTDSGGGQGPISVAPTSLAGRTYALTDSANGTSTLTFNAAGDGYTLTPTGGAADSGSVSASRVGDQWTVTTASTTSTNTGTLTLNFSSETAGSYNWQQAGSDAVTGTFAQTSANPNPNPDPDPNPNPDPGPGTVPAPANLNTLTVTTGPDAVSPNTVYTVNLSGGSSGTFTAVNPEGNSMGSGTYTYTPSGNSANLRLTYPEANNEYDDMTLNFTQQSGSGQANTFTGTQLVGGVVSPFNGTFTY